MRIKSIHITVRCWGAILLLWLFPVLLCGQNYTVSFNALRGGISPDSQIVTAGGNASEPTFSPGYSQLVFKGWYRADNSTFEDFVSDRRVFNISGSYYRFADAPFDFNTPVASNITLYAMWEMVCYFYEGDNSIFYQDYYYVDTYLPRPPGDNGRNWYWGGYGNTNSIWDFGGWSNGHDNFCLYTGTNTSASDTRTVSYETGIPGISIQDAIVGVGSLIPLPLHRLLNENKYLVGWYTDSGFTDLWDLRTDRLTESSPTTIYARWSDNECFTVTFNSQGGSSVAKQSGVESGTALTKPTDPVRSGWTFAGWFKDAACTDPWNFQTDQVTADITLYAKWETTLYSVTFDAGGAQNTPPPQSKAYNEKIKRPSPDPVRPGYIFKGWSMHSDELELWSFEYWGVTADMTLYAWWIPTYTVTFKNGSNVYRTDYVQKRTPEQANIFRVERPIDPIRSGYRFAGWSTTEATGGQVWNFNMGIESDLVLYAHWREYNVTLNASPGNFGVVDNRSVYKIQASVTGGTVTMPSSEPSLSGNNFKGWYTDEARTQLWSPETLSDDMILYADWETKVTVTGTITDKAESKPVSGATIEVFINSTSLSLGYSAVTNDAGEYTIQLPASDSDRPQIRLRVSHPQYVTTHSKPVSLTGATINLEILPAEMSTFYINLSSGSLASNVYKHGVKYEQAKVTNFSYLGYIESLLLYKDRSDLYDIKVKGNLLYADGARVNFPLSVAGTGTTTSLGYSFRKNGYEYRVEEEARSLPGIDGEARCVYYIRRWLHGNTAQESNANRLNNSTYTRVRGLPNIDPATGRKILPEEPDDLHTVVIIDRLVSRGSDYATDQLGDSYVLVWKKEDDPNNPQYRQNRYLFYPFDESGYRISGTQLTDQEADDLGIYPWAIEADPQRASMGYYAASGFEEGVKEQITGIKWDRSSLVGNEQKVWLDRMKDKNPTLTERMLRTPDDNANYAGAELIWDSPFCKNGFLGDIVRIEHRFNIKRNYLDPGVKLDFLANGDNGFIAFLNGKYIACSNSYLGEDGRPRFGVYDFLDERTIIEAMINPETGAPFGDPPLKGVDWSTIVSANVSPSLLNLGGDDSGYNNVLTVYAVNARHVGGEWVDEEGSGRVYYIYDGNSMHNPAFMAYALIGKVDTNMSNLIDAEPLNTIAYQGGTSRSGDAFPRPRFRYWKLNYDKTNDQVSHAEVIPSNTVELGSWQVDGLEYIPNDSRHPDLIYPDAPFRAQYYNGQEILNGSSLAPVGVWRIRTVWDDRVREITIEGLSFLGGESTELNSIYTSNILNKFVEIRPVTKSERIKDNIKPEVADLPDKLKDTYAVIPYNDDPDAPGNTIYVGAYGISTYDDVPPTDPVRVIYPLHTESGFDIKLSPRLMLDDAFPDEAAALNKELADKFTDFRNPIFFYADLINHDNGDVLIRPDLMPDKLTPTPVTICYPWNVDRKSIRIFHFPQVLRRQVPEAHNDPNDSFSREWWGDSLQTDDYTEIKQMSIGFDSKREYVYFTPPAPGMFAIVYDVLKVEYKYLPTNGVAVPEGVPEAPAEASYIAGDKVDVASCPSSDDYAFFGWKDHASSPLNDGKEMRPQMSFIMPDRDVVLNGCWAVAQVKDTPEEDYNKVKYEGLYLSLSDAVRAAKPGQTVQLMVNVKEDVTIDKKIHYDSKFAGLPESVNNTENTIDGLATLAANPVPTETDGTANITLVNDLLATRVGIKAHTFGSKALIDYNGKQVKASRAYFDLTLPVAKGLDPHGWQLYGWYPVNLPFPAMLANVTDAADKPLVHPYDFGVAEYSGLRRASKGIGNEPANPDNDWLYIGPGDGGGDLTINDLNIGNHQTMQAHAAYMVRTSGTPTLRFYASNGTFKGKSEVSVMENPVLPALPAKHKGWNYVAQSLGANATINLPQGAVIQVSEAFSSDRDGLNPAKREKSYVPKVVGPDPNELVLSPYTNFFYQSATSGTIQLTVSDEEATTRSAASGKGYTDPVAPSRYELRLSDGTCYDALFVSASPDSAANRYRVGRDVLKMDGMSASPLRLWSRKEGADLCAIDAPLHAGEADVPLWMSFSEKKEYLLSVDSSAGDGSRLWLLKDGVPVCDLTETGKYRVEGTPADRTAYSLRFVSGKEEDARIRAYGTRLGIVIEGVENGAPYTVTDASGVVVAQGDITDFRMHVPVRYRGVYIVSAGGARNKVIVTE